MRIAGRCECGTVLEWVARRPDEHMRCVGLRWCGVCGEVAHYVQGGNGRCPSCTKRHRQKYRQTHARPPETPERRARQRKAKAAQRRANDPAYQREKERKRRKYASDPAWAEAKRQAVAAAYALEHPEPARDGRAARARAARGTLHGRHRVAA